MNRNEQELHKDIKRVAVALERLVKLMTKMIRENGWETNRKNKTI